MPEYRVAFFNHLRRTLTEKGIHLQVIYGQPSNLEATRGDFASLNWGTEITNRSIRVGSRELIWQPCLKGALDSDLVIVEQASRLLANHAIFALHSIGRTRQAFWGHGKNLRSHAANRTAEKLKAFESKRVHWWFAYTDSSAAIVRELGFPQDRITSVNNTLDTTSLQTAESQLTPQDLEAERRRLGLNGANCGLFIGGMYPEKRLAFLLSAVVRIRSLVPDFELIMVGGGPDAELARRAEAQYDWIRYLGPLPGQLKVLQFSLCKLLLSPGLVGLTIVDSFALRLPMVTIDLPYHSPEIDYLRNGRNGVMLPTHTTPEDYASAVAALLVDDGRRQVLAAECANSSREYTLENMVKRFSEGIRLALAQDRGG